MAGGAKNITPVKHGARKGLMKGPSTQQEKAPVLLREDPKYALEKLSSVISTDDYEDLGNHSTEAMGETGLFSIAQGLMGRCLSHETTLGRLREKAKVTDDELTQLRAWRVVQEKKLKMAEEARDDYFKRTEELSKVLEDREKEIREAKVDAVREYRDFDDLLLELGSSYNDGFDDALRQVKSLYPDLDISSVNISIPEQTSVQPTKSDDTDQLFGDEAQVDGAQVERTVAENDPTAADVRQEGTDVPTTN